MRAIYQSVFAWASICLVLVMILNDPKHNSISIMFFFTIPFESALIYYAMVLRKKWISQTPLYSNMNAFVVELKVIMNT